MPLNMYTKFGILIYLAIMWIRKDIPQNNF